MKKQPPTISMDFQDIDLDTLADILPAKQSSRFSQLHAGLRNKIKNASGPFLFAAKNKFDENGINSITASVNGFLHKRNVGWRVRYSDKAKAFACYQITPKMVKRKYMPRADKEKMGMPELTALAQKVFKVNLDTVSVFERSRYLKAMFVVARNICGITLENMAEPFGYNPASPSSYIRRAKSDPKVMELVKQLTAAVNEKLGA